MSRINLGVACMLAAMFFTTGTDAHAASKRIPGLHISSVPTFYGNHTRVPRVVRGFNPKQHVVLPKNGIGLAPRR